MTLDKSIQQIAMDLAPNTLSPNVPAWRESILQAMQDVLNGGTQRDITWHERVPVERLFDVRIGPVVVENRRGALISFYDLTSARRVESRIVHRSRRRQWQLHPIFASAGGHGRALGRTVQGANAGAKCVGWFWRCN